MSRYIDADALKENMRGKFIDSVEERIAIREIDNAPTIDMGDLISRNDVINAISENYGGEHFTDAIIDLIDSAPSIDIVRCKECKWLRYCETENLDPYLDCDKPDAGGIPRNEEWFCADGERREP